MKSYLFPKLGYLTALFATAVVAAPAQYTLTPITIPLPYGGREQVLSFNNGGTALVLNPAVSFQSGTPGPTTSSYYLWKNGMVTNVTALKISGASTTQPPQPEVINDNGAIAGLYQTKKYLNSPGFILQGSTLTTLTLPTQPASAYVMFQPTDINNLNQVVAYVVDASFNNYSVVWSNGYVTQLPALPPDAPSTVQALKINNMGVVAGWAGTHAVVWTNAVPQALYTPANALSSTADDINNYGMVVGDITYQQPSLFPQVNGVMTAAVWKNGVLTQLPYLNATQTLAYASAINDVGDIVGWSGTVLGTSGTATRWSGTQVADLNALIASTDPLKPYITLTTASFINSLGQIVAYGKDSRTGVTDMPYLLTPKP